MPSAAYCAGIFCVLGLYKSILFFHSLCPNIPAKSVPEDLLHDLLKSLIHSYPFQCNLICEYQCALLLPGLGLYISFLLLPNYAQQGFVFPVTLQVVP